MLGQNKLQKERNQKLLQDLILLPGNNICADCRSRNPKWASYNLGIFICMPCASIHRKIGTHITKVKSLTMDDWTREQVETMRTTGNIKSNAIYNPNELRYPPPPNLEDSERDSDLEQYIRSKYQYRKFLDKSALVASKLGPSKSASFIEKSNPAPSSERNQSPASTPTDQVLTATAAAASVVIPHRRPIVSPGHAALAKSNIPDCPLGLDKKTTPVPSTSSSSVWGDLSSLSTPGQDSSLPLQYKAPNSVPEFQLTTSTVSGPTTSTSYPIGVTSTGMGMNPFQSQMLTPSQQPMMSPFVPAGPIISTSFNNMPQQPFGQQWGTHPMMQSTTQTSFFQPQPQMSVQMQTTPNQQFISAPVTPTHHFLASSPSQQLRSHNSQPQLVQPLQTTTPTSAGFLLQTPISSQVNMGLGVSTSGRGTLGHPSFLDTTTMQMVQQQQMMQQQQQMMQQQQMLQQQQMFGVPQMQPMAASQMGPGGNVYGGGQVYSQGSQWGAI